LSRSRGCAKNQTKSQESTKFVHQPSDELIVKFNEYDTMEMKINEFLANKQVLFVMDNIDDCLKNNEDDLKTLLTNLLDKN
jgi:hypothetical protein